MDPRFQAYANARQAVLNANNPAALAAAENGLRQAEEAVRVELDKAWNANVAAIHNADRAVVDAVREQARVEVEVGNAARTRNPTYPLLTGEEMDLVRAVAADADEARETSREARATFKAGVTAEQLEAVA